MTKRDPIGAAGKWPSSSDVSDACDHLNVEAARTGRLRPAWPGCPPVAGRVRTIRLEPATSGSPLATLLELLAEAQDMVVVVDLAGRGDCQGWGEVVATAARGFGVRGALVNGGVRDVLELERLAFPTYARSVFPGAMAGRLALAGVDEAVDIEGVSIAAGDFVVADGDGIVALPHADRDRVIGQAAKRRADEREALAAVAQGADPRAIFGRPESA